MDRLANYAKQFPEQIPSDVNVIEIFSDYIERTADVCIISRLILQNLYGIFVIASFSQLTHMYQHYIFDSEVSK